MKVCAAVRGSVSFPYEAFGALSPYCHGGVMGNFNSSLPYLEAGI